MGVPILGTSAENVDAAEDRELFDEILEKCCIPRPTGGRYLQKSRRLRQRMRLVIRYLYVLHTYSVDRECRSRFLMKDILEFMDVINRHAQEHPILIDKYLMGVEVEVDAVCDGDDIVIPGIMEHVERAGIHSGDSISVYPAQTLSPKTKRVIADYTKKLAKAFT